MSELHPVSTDRPSTCLRIACTPPPVSRQSEQDMHHRPIKWVKLTIHDHQITDHVTDSFLLRRAATGESKPLLCMPPHSIPRPKADITHQFPLSQTVTTCLLHQPAISIGQELAHQFKPLCCPQICQYLRYSH